MTIEIEARGPYIEATVSDVLSTNDLPVLLSAIREASARGPFVVLTDTLKMKSVGSGVLAQFSDGMKRLPPMKDVWLADAVVVGSPVAQFALSTLILVTSLPTEMKVFNDRAPAIEWCSRVLHLAGRAIENRKSHEPPSTFTRGARRP